MALAVGLNHGYGMSANPRIPPHSHSLCAGLTFEPSSPEITFSCILLLFPIFFFLFSKAVDQDTVPQLSTALLSLDVSPKVRLVWHPHLLEDRKYLLWSAFCIAAGTAGLENYAQEISILIRNINNNNNIMTFRSQLSLPMGQHAGPARIIIHYPWKGQIFKELFCWWKRWSKPQPPYFLNRQKTRV